MPLRRGPISFNLTAWKTARAKAERCGAAEQTRVVQHVGEQPGGAATNVLTARSRPADGIYRRETALHAIKLPMATPAVNSINVYRMPVFQWASS